MTMERYIRIIAGTFVLASLALAVWVNIHWLWLTAFVGANLFQSGFTNWCLMENILEKLGIARRAAVKA
jgi:formyltetrahydrofolate hydrolase